MKHPVKKKNPASQWHPSKSWSAAVTRLEAMLCVGDERPWELSAHAADRVKCTLPTAARRAHLG